MELQPIGTPAFMPPAPATLPSQTVTASGFADWLLAQVGELNRSMTSAEQASTRLAAGGAESLHHTMIALEESRLTFQLAVQVRNRVLEAYQDVLRMQV